MIVLRTRTFVLWLVVLTVIFVLLFPRVISEIASSPESLDALTQPNAQTSVAIPAEILFTGDIMLGRDVERRNLATDLVGALEIFSNFSEYEAIVINLEGPVPDRHVPTPDFGFQFSIRNDFLPILESAGITHVGLANNHTYDHGRLGYEQTVVNVVASGLEPFGHPTILDERSVSYVDTDYGRVALIGIHTLFTVPGPEVIERIFTEAEKSADFIVAYIHWGEEYELEQDNRQRQFAETIVAAGADLIIGHHPHVVQGIEMVSGVPVVYSLGNTIFDQYFSQDVQEGLLVTLELMGDAKSLVLHPITSVGTPTHPRKMEDFVKIEFLQSLATRSSPVLVEQIINGKISW